MPYAQPPAPPPQAPPPPAAELAPPPPPPPPPPELEPEPEPEPEPAVEEDLPSDDELEEMLGPEEEMDTPSGLGDDVDEDLTDIDADALENMEDPEPLSDFGSDGVEEDYSDIDPEDLPDPEPIPSNLSGSDIGDDSEPKSRMVLWIPLGVGLIVLLLLGGAVFMRETVVGIMPGTNAAFSLIGLHVPIPGEGLRISKVKVSRETVGRSEALVVAGEITNITNEVQAVPKIRALLYDGNEQVVQTSEISPAKSSLKPKEVMKFRVQVENLVATARRSEVTFGELETAQAEPAAKKDTKK